MAISMRDAFQRLVEIVTQSRGALPPRQRQAIVALAERPDAGRDLATPDEPPEPLAALTREIALHAHRVGDDDIARLRAAGYSEDALYEAIVSAALGAGRARMERGLAALDAANARRAPAAREDADATQAG